MINGGRASASSGQKTPSLQLVLQLAPRATCAMARRRELLARPRVSRSRGRACSTCFEKRRGDVPYARMFFRG